MGVHQATLESTQLFKTYFIYIYMQQWGNLKTVQRKVFIMHLKVQAERKKEGGLWKGKA